MVLSTPSSMIVWLFVFILYIRLYVIVKILIKDHRLSLKEIIYIIATPPFMAITNDGFGLLFYTIGLPHSLSEILLMFVTIEVLKAFVLILYLWKLKSYTIKKSIILAFATMILFAAANLFFVFFFLDIIITSLSYPLWRYAGQALVYVISILFTLMIVKASESLREIADQSKLFQTILLCGVIFLFVTFQITGFFVGPMLGNVLPVYAFVLLSFYAAVLSGSFIIYSKFLKTKYDLQRNEDEQRSFQYYTNEIEQQYTGMRKFKHDYQNVLASLDVFIAEKDWEGLEKYYKSEIKPVSDTIISDSFALEALSKIKVKPLKSILAAKLMTAQNISVDIDTSFEVNQEIDTIPLDSINLVRMLGIILDNAIEALEELGYGKLMVGCFKNGRTITIIVQNTCRPDIPKLHRLERLGFSTKGEGRGLGLYNLAELVDYCPNAVLETSIAEDQFIQKLIISGP